MNTEQELARIKAQQPKVCRICGRWANDQAHIFPRSTYPQYKTLAANLVILCRECHERFDNDPQFRATQHMLMRMAETFATPQEVYRRFDKRTGV